jgi:hypothetical protein
MNLPNYPEAFIDITKLSEYCLSEEHPLGKFKAYLFKNELGITKEHSLLLKDEILRGLVYSKAKKKREDHFGTRYSVNIKIRIFEKEAMVCTAWIIRTEEDFPRLTTCYIKK